MSRSDRIREVIASSLLISEDDIEPDSRLIRDLGAESIDLLDILFRLEQEFDVKLPRGEIERRARGSMSDDEFAKGGVLTEVARERLKEVMPEVSPAELVPGLTLRDIPQLMTVRTLERIVAEAVGRDDVRAARDKEEPPCVSYT
jgi:acyl carrier protein